MSKTDEEVREPGSLGAIVGSTTYNDAHPSAPLHPTHERYAVLRASGHTVSRAAKMAGAHPQTARFAWEPPIEGGGPNGKGRSYNDGGVGGAIQRRIAYLRELDAKAAAYTLGQLVGMQMRLIHAAEMAGDFSTALKYTDKMIERVSKAQQHEGAEVSAIEAEGDEVDLMAELANDGSSTE